MKRNKKGLKIAAALIAAVLLVLTVGKNTFSYALIDKTNAVHITASKVDNATLIIGTHLIYLGSMNDQIYEIALKSAKKANQYKRYYKSEIAGGTWYDITQAQSLKDITSEGNTVSAKEIEELWLTHHTKANGLTYYLKKNTAVSIYDINNPYDLELMEELEPVKMQYDRMVETKDKSDTIERDILYIKEFYKLDRQTTNTKSLDSKIAALQTYYEKLVKENAGSAMCDKVLAVMEKLDAARRVEVLGPLMDTHLQNLVQAVGREFVYIEGEITGDYTKVTAYQKEQAAAAAEEAEEQMTAELEAEIDVLEEELKAIEEERDYRIADRTAAIKENYNLELEEETDTAKISQLKTEMNSKISSATQEIKNKYSSEISKLESEISSAKNGVSSKAQSAANQASQEVMNAGRATIEGFVPNSELLTAISTAISNVQESYMDYSSKMLNEGNTVLSRAEYSLVNELITKANSKAYTSCDELVEKMIYLDRVYEGIISEDKEESDFIENTLLKNAQKEYKTSLSAGTGAEYKALSSSASDTTKAHALKTQLNETEIIRNEYQFILQAYIDRLSVEDAVKYITDRIEDADTLETGIKSDAYKDYALTSVQYHLEWLTKTLESLQEAGGNSTLDNLLQQKNELQTKLMTALDNGLLEEAKKIEVQIAALDLEIDEIEKELSNILGSETSSAAQKAIARAGLSAGTATATLQDLKEEALEAIKKGNFEGIESILEGIGALASTQPSGTLSALKEIYQEIANQQLLGKEEAALSLLAEKVEMITAGQMRNFISRYTENDLAVLIAEFMEIPMTDLYQETSGQNTSSLINREQEDVSDDDRTEDEEDWTEDDEDWAEDEEEWTEDEEDWTEDDDEDWTEDEEDWTEDDDEDWTEDDEEDWTEDDEEDWTEDDEEDWTEDDEEQTNRINTEGNQKQSTKLESVMSQLSEEQMAVVLAALSRYAEENTSEEMENILNTYGKRMVYDNKYVFGQLKDPTFEFVPTDKLAQITGYRYIFNDSQKAVTLQKKGQYYKFTAFSNMVGKGNAVQEMAKAAGFQGVIYIPEDVTQEYFSLAAQYLYKTSYGVILTDEMQKKAEEFRDYLMEAGVISYS